MLSDSCFVCLVQCQPQVSHDHKVFELLEYLNYLNTKNVHLNISGILCLLFFFSPLKCSRLDLESVSVRQ